MGHSEADEHHRTTIGSRHCGEQSGDEQELVAHALGVKPQVFGILFTLLAFTEM